MKTTLKEIGVALAIGWVKWATDEDRGAAIVQVRDLLKAERLAMLDELAEFGCPHACSPPCPFHRRIADMRRRERDS